MPTFKVTAKRDIGGSKGISKGTTFQVTTPSGINSLDANKIKAAIAQQLGIDMQSSYCVVNNFDVVKM